jgi:hypothetical protein
MSEKMHLYEVPASQLMFRRVDGSWDGDTLLREQGWFPLADAMKKIDSGNTGQYRRILAYRERLVRDGEDWPGIMGLRQYGSRLWAHMPVFSEWYLGEESLQVSRVPKSWDLQTFLNQKSGIFSLKGVLRLLPDELPLEYGAMKSMIHKHRNPRNEIGADKLENTNYVVFMPRFGEWLRQQIPAKS